MQYSIYLCYRHPHSLKKCPFKGCRSCSCIMCKASIQVNGGLPLCGKHRGYKKLLMDELGKNDKKEKEAKENEKKEKNKERVSKTDGGVRNKRKRCRASEVTYKTCAHHSYSPVYGESVEALSQKASKLSLDDPIKKSTCPICQNDKWIVVRKSYYKKNRT